MRWLLLDTNSREIDPAFCCNLARDRLTVSVHLHNPDFPTQGEGQVCRGLADLIKGESALRVPSRVYRHWISGAAKAFAIPSTPLFSAAVCQRSEPDQRDEEFVPGPVHERQTDISLCLMTEQVYLRHTHT